MSTRAFRSCLIVSTAALIIVCLCCAVQGLVLGIQQHMRGTDAAALTRQVEQRLVDAASAHQSLAGLWAQFEGDDPNRCTAVPVDVPEILVVSANEAREHAQLAAAVDDLNHAIDRIAWGLKTWQSACAGAISASEALAQGPRYVEEARLSIESASMALRDIAGR